jgi:hypothetical protein
MSAEPVTITFTRYRTPAGAPTCALDFETGAVCEFHRVRSFGTVDVCHYTGADVERAREPPGQQRTGYLIPDKSCPLWVNP